MMTVAGQRNGSRICITYYNKSSTPPMTANLCSTKAGFIDKLSAAQVNIWVFKAAYTYEVVCITLSSAWVVLCRLLVKPPQCPQILPLCHLTHLPDSCTPMHFLYKGINPRWEIIYSLFWGLKLRNFQGTRHLWIHGWIHGRTCLGLGAHLIMNYGTTIYLDMVLESEVGVESVQNSMRMGWRTWFTVPDDRSIARFHTCKWDWCWKSAKFTSKFYWAPIPR